MLRIIRKAIDSIPDVPFNQYYVNYIAEVQDRNIELEIKSLIRTNVLDPLSLSSIIQNTYEKLGDILDFSKGNSSEI